MSGHSKWNNIKRTKGKADALKAASFTKIGRELAVAVKVGGADPSSNSRLRDVIAKAKAANIPNDNIQRSIKKASGELGAINYETVVYEGYGPAGSAVLVETLTDNRNRTVSDVRHLFDKYGGSLGTTGCVSFMFDTKGVLIAEKRKSDDDDGVMMLAIDAGAEDFSPEGDVYEILTAPSDLEKVREALAAGGMNILSGGAERIAQNFIDLSPEDAARYETLIEKLEELDDVQNVYSNVNENE
ncbi:MAG: YebC/PmpR family DNA-binding transcriptional regulator [Clostridiales bacterium]|jgi:YebC/PmpR family DNA-binding regulatory protein|nr:YebC/PmpR family DNA-binding transcriptional regulator [Clostridiales bacterium]